MPLEIKELHIKVAVSEPSAEMSTDTFMPDSPSSVEPTPALVEACVEKIMEILKSKVER